MASNLYTRQKKYVSKIKKICKRISIWIPKNKEEEIKAIAKKMRDES